jgi:hypothetical protein
MTPVTIDYAEERLTLPCEPCEHGGKLQRPPLSVEP